MISVLIVKPNKEPYVKEILPDLKSMQQEVGGYIQAIYPFEDPIAIVCNEEAKLLGMPLNRALRDADGHIYDIIAGDFFIVGIGSDDFESLPSELQDKFAEFFKTPEQFLRINGKIVVLSSSCDK